MCRRFTLHHNLTEVAKRFGAQEVLMTMPLRFNIAPMQPVAVIVHDTRFNLRALQPMQWGLVPGWAKDTTFGNRLFNARAETLTENAAYKHALKRRRCLIPADGFYEWSNTGGKVPHHIRLPREDLFAFAGLWEEWDSPDGSPLRSCAIITVEPNAAMRKIHQRMPAILPRTAEAAWLSSTLPVNDGLAMLRPWPGELEIFPVSHRVNDSKVDEPSLLAREHDSAD